MICFMCMQGCSPSIVSITCQHHCFFPKLLQCPIHNFTLVGITIPSIESYKVATALKRALSIAVKVRSFAFKRNFSVTNSVIFCFILCKCFRLLITIGDLSLKAITVLVESAFSPSTLVEPKHSK